MPLGEITDADLDLFIEDLIPGISQANIDKITPEHRATMLETIMEIMAYNYESGKGQEGVLADMDELRAGMAAVRSRKQAELRTGMAAGEQEGAMPGGRMNVLSMIGLASFTLAAVIAGATASRELKKKYDEIMDDWNARFHVDPSSGDGAPDQKEIIPFYNNDSTKKLITNLNQFARDAAVYVNSQKPTFSESDFPPPIAFGTLTDTEDETLPPISKKEARAREALLEAVNVSGTKVAQDGEIPVGYSFLNSDTFGGMLNGIGNLAGISTAAYLHYKSITQPQVGIPFPVFPTFGTATAPVNNAAPVVEPTDYFKTASDMFKQAKSMYDIYKEYSNKTTEEVKQNTKINQTDAAQEVEKTMPDVVAEVETPPPTTAEVATEVETPPPTTADVVAEVETPPPTTADVVTEVETRPQTTADVVTEVETPPPTTEVVAEVETQPPTTEVEPEADEVPELPVQTEGSDVVTESVVSDTIISRLMEPSINRVLAKGLSQSKAGTIAPVLSSIVASVLASNKSLANATSSVLLESVVAAGLGKIMPTSFATTLAAPFVSALAAAIRVNATMGSVADSTMEAAFLPVFTVLLTGALTPHVGFALGSMAATVGARMAYDAAKSTAAVTVDVIKKVEEIREELVKREEEQAAKRIKIEQEQPSLRAMADTPNHILEENIIKNITQEQTEEEGLSSAAPGGPPQSGEEIQRDREISREIQRDRSLGNTPRVQINSKKRSREAIDRERVFSRDTSLNGLPMYWSMQNIFVRDDDQLRTPIA
jgi:hypothetical protein